MSSGPFYTIHELAARTGASLHQIRRWRLAGAVSPPLKRNPSWRVWSPEHVSQIEAILAARENTLTLADFRDRVQVEERV